MASIEGTRVLNERVLWPGGTNAARLVVQKLTGGLWRVQVTSSGRGVTVSARRTNIAFRRAMVEYVGMLNR